MHINDFTPVGECFFAFLYMLVELANNPHTQSQHSEHNQRIINKFYALMNKNHYFDIGLVLMVRRLAKKAVDYFEKHQDIEVDLSGNLLVLSDYIEDIMIFGREAEQIVISAFAKYTLVNIVVNYIEKNQANFEDPEVLIDNHTPNGVAYLTVDLFFRPGMYLLVYRPFLKQIDYLYNKISIP